MASRDISPTKTLHHLRHAPGHVREAARGFTAAQLIAEPAEGWSARTCLAHIVAASELWTERVLELIAGEANVDPAKSSIYQWMIEQGYHEMSFIKLRRQFELQREVLLNALETVDEDFWDTDAGQIVARISRHEQQHLKQLKQILDK